MVIERAIIQIGEQGSRATAQKINLVATALARARIQQQIFARASRRLINLGQLEQAARLSAQSRVFGLRVTALNDRLRQTTIVSRRAAAGTKALSSRFSKVSSALRVARRTLVSWTTFLVVGFLAAVTRAQASMAKLGGSVVVAKQQFVATSQSMGTMAANFLPKLRRATLGTISDFELMRLANFALSSGLDISNEKFAQLAEGAVKLAKVTGRDATEALQRLTFGIVKQERRILDELTIIVRANDIFKDFAKQQGIVNRQLTAQEKLQAFLGATLQGVNERVATFKDVNFEAATAGERASAAFENLKNRIAEIFVESGAAEIILSILTGAIEDLFGALADPAALSAVFITMQETVQLVVDLVKLLIQLFRSFLPLIRSMINLLSVVARIVTTILEPFARLGALIGGVPITEQQEQIRAGLEAGGANQIGEAAADQFAALGERDNQQRRVLNGIMTSVPPATPLVT